MKSISNKKWFDKECRFKETRAKENFKPKAQRSFKFKLTRTIS